MRIARSLRLFPALPLAALLIGCGGGQSPSTVQVPRSQSAQPIQSTLPPAGIPAVQPPKVFGESAIVIDAHSGHVLYAKNADQRRPVASTQKLITALVSLDAGGLNDRITIRPVDTQCEPTKLYLRAGETYTRGELLKALIVRSGNDISRAIAREAAGSESQFSAAMNRKARSLGMRNSNFVTSNGLPAPGQYSTARDIAIAARAAYRNPAIRSWAQVKKYTFNYDDGRTKTLKNTNKVLDRVSYCNGLKTGTTNAAGRCLVSSWSHNGRSVISVVLKSNSSHIWDDSEKLLRWALESPRR
jgi:D-alanyl-D-alanine carboxypeptidase (penicillin-binding protein 5/6)